MKWIITIIVGMLALLLTGSQPTDPTFGFEFEKRGDTCTVEIQNDRTVFFVRSETGIGKMAVTLEKGKWPENLVFHFTYANGDGFQNMEAFEVTTDRFCIVGSMKESGRMRYYVPGADGNYDLETIWKHVDVTVRRNKDGIDVALPADMMSGVKRMSLHWLDAFRR